MKRLSVVLAVLLLVGLVTTSVFADSCCRKSICEDWSDFQWSVGNNGVVRFRPRFPRSVARYNWNFGDGEGYSSFEDSSFTHRYEDNGTYVVQLRAKNVCGEWESTTRRITIDTASYERQCEACHERYPETKVYSTCGSSCGSITLGIIATVIFFTVL